MGLQIWPIPWWLPVWKLLRYQRVPLIPITSPEMSSEWVCIYIYRIKQIHATYRHTSLLIIIIILPFLLIKSSCRTMSVSTPLVSNTQAPATCSFRVFQLLQLFEQLQLFLVTKQLFQWVLSYLSACGINEVWALGY